MSYRTPHQLRQQRAAERRAPFANRPADAVEYLDEVATVWPDPRTRPAAVVEHRNQTAAGLTGRRQED